MGDGTAATVSDSQLWNPLGPPSTNEYNNFEIYNAYGNVYPLNYGQNLRGNLKVCGLFGRTTTRDEYGNVVIDVTNSCIDSTLSWKGYGAGAGPLTDNYHTGSSDYGCCWAGSPTTTLVRSRYDEVDAVFSCDLDTLPQVSGSLQATPTALPAPQASIYVWITATLNITC